MSKLTPQGRAINQLRADGWTVDVVERISRRGALTWRNDLFGGFDLLAVRGAETMAIQVTSRSNVAARVSKIAELPALPALRKAGWRLQVWGWGITKRLGCWRVEDVS